MNFFINVISVNIKDLFIIIINQSRVFGKYFGYYYFEKYFGYYYLTNQYI